jgi:hypothetical protein
MSLTVHSPRRSPWRRLPSVLALAVIVSSVLAACAAGADPTTASFDPTGPCTADGQRPGAYPDLEGLLPAAWGDRAPDNLNSGRTCTTEALGTLAGQGVDELRFAGATWKLGAASGMTVAVFDATGLDPAKMIEFYEAGAKVARRTDKYQVSETTVGGQPASRLDVLGSDGTAQTVVAWPAKEPGRVNVLLAADLGDTKVAEVLDTLGTR